MSARKFAIIALAWSYAASAQADTFTTQLNWPATGAQKHDGTGLLVDPVRPSDFYSFYETPGGNTGTNHVLKSTDYGQTWSQIDQTTFNGNAWGVAIDPNINRNPNTAPTLYTPGGYGDMGIWKSVDGGGHWVNVFTPTQAQTCVVPKSGGGSVSIPIQNGQGCMDFYQVHILPDNPPNHILATYHYGSGLMMESTDGGQSWSVHSIPSDGGSDYMLGVTPTTWLSISPGTAGVHRTTTAGRDGSGQISPSAWSPVNGAGGWYHIHGSFTPFVDTNGDIYFAGGGGVICSSDQGANWHSIIDGNFSTVAGTANHLYLSMVYSTGLWQVPKGCSQPTIDHNQCGHNACDSLPFPSTWNGAVPPYGSAASFDGSHWVINQASYAQGTTNGDIWRYVEGVSGPPPSACDVNGDNSTNVSDVQLCVNQAIGITSCTTGDINKDGNCSVVDVQRDVNAALGGACVTQ